MFTHGSTTMFHVVIILFLCSLIVIAPFAEARTAITLSRHSSNGTSSAVRKVLHRASQRRKRDLSAYQPRENHLISAHKRDRRRLYTTPLTSAASTLTPKSTAGMMATSTIALANVDLDAVTDDKGTGGKGSDGKAKEAIELSYSGKVTSTSTRTPKARSTSSSTTIQQSSAESTVASTTTTASTSATTSSIASTSATIIDLNNIGSLAYSIDVVVGNATVPVIVDTGSSQFWVPAISCSTCSSAGMTLSDLTVSADCASQNITYGIGSVEGCLIDSTLSLGVYELTDLEVLGVSAVDSEMANEGGTLSGILGLASASTADGSATVVKALYEAGMIDAEIVSFYLSYNDSMQSEMTFGTVINSTQANVDESVTLQPTGDSTDLYEVTMDAFQVNGETVQSDVTAIVDTGSSYIYAPKAAVDLIYSYFEATVKNTTAGYAIPCDTSSGDSVSVVFGGKTFSIPYSYLVGSASSEEDGYCISKIATLSGMDSWVLGDTFLQTVYTSFNVATGEVTLYEMAV